MDPNYDLEELSYSLQLCEPFSVSDINPSMKSIAHDISSTEILSGALNCVSLVEISGQRDDKENGKFRLDDIVGMKFHDHICSSPPRRSARVTLSNRKNISRKAAKECGKQVIENELLESISRVGKKARSCNCRPARSSVWGSVGISKYFQKSASVFINNGSKKSQKGGVTRGSGKGKSDQVATGLQVSNGNSIASLGRIRIKVNLGKEMDQTCSTDMVSATENVPIYVEATGTRTCKLTNFNGDNSNEEVLKVKGTQCCDEDLQKVVTSSELLDTFPTEELKSSETDRKLDGFAADSHQGISFPVDVEEPGVSVDNKYLDLGTSPDSEVINVIPEAQVNVKESEDFHDVQISSQTCVAAADIASLNLPIRRRKKGRKSENMPSARSINDQDIVDRPRVLDNASVVEKCGQEERPRDGIEFTEAFGLASTANLSSNTSSSEVAPGELFPSSMAGDIENVSPCTKTKVLKHLKSSTSKKGSKVGSEMFESPCSQSGNSYKQKRNVAKSVGKKKVKDKAACGEFARTIKDYHEAGYDSLDGYGKVKTGDENAAQEKIDVDVARETTQPNIDVEVKHTDQCMPTRNAWVLCDECSKWRRIPAILADSIDETNSRWTCKENVDKDFADCSIPQEKSNSEINAELEISDGEDAFIDGSNPKGSQLHPLEGHERSSWKLIKSNKFMHRSRKSQTIDEIMVCHCKPLTNGKLGCGDGCLNRMLNIECVRGTCPCGENCSNQQFQKRKYAKLKWFRCGKKGYGLQLQEDISEGQFLIEYIGEVLDMQAYEARQKDYASQCHKHFYFMTLNGSEVIDACAKGNLGRFINHSCDPNCRTEKWMVNGEVCVGLFALKDLKKGEEVTFDYNYVRVFGAAAKRCVCGSSHCRGYIGGDPRNSEVVVQGDSDDEFPEPVMVYDDGEIDDSLKKLISTTSTSDDAKTSIANMEQVLTCEDKLERAETIVEHLEGTEELRLGDVLVNEDNKADKSANDVHHLKAICENSRSKKLQIAFEVMEKPVKALQPLIQKLISPLQTDIDSVGTISDPREVVFSSPEASALKEVKKKTVSDSSNIKKKHKLDKIDDKRAPKSKTLIQTSRLSSSIKKGKSSITNSGTLNKPESMVSKSPGLSYKPKKIIGGSATGRFEVEEKLNEVLDVDGGISKRQDAAQGYLKLLFLTAASGDSVGGEAYQSNRDLSMILGAIWKTKSRSVLVDVISKNGLQMLHNILKRCRRAFNRIPILRKLLKVLEFLATKEILTVELINKDPSHEGVESFRESILSLAEHDDKQVHQIARNFRDRWIRRSLRRNNGFHRGFIGNRHPSHNHCQERNSQTRDTVNDNKQSSPADVPVAVDTVMNEGCSSSFCNSVYPSIGTQTRKRKSRWDQPADSNKEQKFQPGFDNTCTTVKDECLKTRADDEGANMDEDVPPGFAPPRNESSINLANGFPCKVELGHPQGKFMNRLAVSYGIPMPIVQQLGYPKTDGLEDWFIAPGVPFQPYPPLPTCTRNRYDDTRDYKGNRQPDHNPPSTSGFVPSDVEIQGTNNCDSFQKAGSSHGVGRYFRQQKWNNARLPPPWKRKENGRVFMGNSSRNRMWGNRNGIEGGNMDIYPNSFTHNPQQEGYH